MRLYKYRIMFKKSPTSRLLHKWERFATHKESCRRGVLKALKSEGWDNAVIVSLKRIP